MRKLTLGLLFAAMLLAMMVVPAFADHKAGHEPVSGGPLHCALQSPFGEALRGAPAQGQGAGDNAGGDPANPPADQAGEGSHKGDAKSWENGKVCGPTRPDGPPRDDPTP